jgi:hydroxymethylpyrimidine kinase/phosphomethylpyrimidine kinase/thiamine-phosphate diphosphorylase
MNCRPEDMLVYAVTDRAWLKGESLKDQVEKALRGGATFVQLREKNLDRSLFLEEAAAIKEVCASFHVPFVINDDVEIALASGADGVHVGQKDMDVREARRRLGPGRIIGVSCKTVEQARAAEAGGADYLGVGAMYPTDTKSDTSQVTVETLRAICEAVEIPVVAIGGIRVDRIEPLRGTGADGVAVVSAIFGQPDIEAAARSLKETAEMYLGRHRRRKTALTIAGSDSSGGAGIQADLKTMLANGVYGMSAITALTAQNTLGVSGIFPVTPEFLGMQIDSVFSDIRPDAVKIGMVSSKELIQVIADRLSYHKAANIVADPVMVSTSGSRLIDEDAVGALKELLLPMAAVVTPNIPEAEVLSGIRIRSSEDMVRAAEIISREYGCAVLCKGGHRLNDANDLLYRDGSFRWFMGRRIDNPNTHGTGCTLSSAIASGLARGYGLEEAVERAKEYLSGALEAMLDLGAGSGPMDHGFRIP